jgi:glycosyltransferase involved in cell wall biosynthesis
LQDSEDRERMGARCREVVLEEYTLEHQAEAYRALYEDLLSSSHT